MLDILSTPLHTPSYLVTCLGLLRVRPHPPAAYIGYSPVLVPNSLVPSTPGALTWLPLQLMDRDPYMILSWTTLLMMVKPQKKAPPPR